MTHVRRPAKYLTLSAVTVALWQRVMDTGAGGERPKSAKKVKPRPKSGVSGQTLRPKTGTRREVRRLSTFHATGQKGVASSAGAGAGAAAW